jgi:hypothetical protein
MTTMTRSRGWRRWQRHRVVRRRLREMLALSTYWWKLVPGRLATGQVWLGCPDGRNCPFCRRPFERAKQRREVAQEIASAEDNV